MVDTAVVVSFAVIGRDSHGMTSDWGEVLRISAPFLLGLLVATAVLPVLTTRWGVFTPLSPATGIWVGVVTLTIGMLLRRFAFDDGTAAVFVVITSAWILGLMVGWRLLYGAGRRLIVYRR